MNLTGSYWLLFHLPTWITAMALLFVCIDGLRLGREILEGFPYNISWSSEWGDKFLIAAIMIGVTEIQRQGSVPPGYESLWFQAKWALIAAGIGFAWQIIVILKSGELGTFVDGFHNIAVVAVFVYLARTTALLPFYYGGKWERAAAICLFSAWVVLVLCDYAAGRLDQLKWLKRRGVNWPGAPWK